MACELAVIGGTGLYDPSFLEEPTELTVATPYGTVPLFVGRREGRQVAFLPRHGQRHGVPPHRVNYRGNLWALRQLGVRRCLGTAACGSLRRELAPGRLVSLDQFLDFTRGRPSTYFDGGEEGVRHADMTEPYCPELRAALADAAAALGLGLAPSATYVCTEGPRFETPAEIRAYALLGGDLVGMTGVPEVVLARELGICYASVAIATNFAAGLAGRPLSHAEVVEAMGQATRDIRRLLGEALGRVGAEGCRHCPPAVPPVGLGKGGSES